MTVIAGLEHTLAALSRYDIDEKPVLDRLLEDAETNQDIEAWQRSTETARTRVCDAYYEDCIAQGIPNDREHCRLLSLSQLREWSGA